MAQVSIDGKPLTPEEQLFLVVAVMDTSIRQSQDVIRFGPRGADPHPENAARAQQHHDMATDLINRMTRKEPKPPRQSARRRNSSQPTSP